MQTMDHHYQQWSQNAPRGLLLIGAGISVIGHAVLLKTRRKRGWVIFGSLGLILLNAGISIFGDAVKHRTLYESKLEA